MKSFSLARHFLILWTVAYQAPPSLQLSRQEYWSGLPFLSSGGLPDPGIELRSSVLQADSLPSEPPVREQISKTDYHIGNISWAVTVALMFAAEEQRGS